MVLYALPPLLLSELPNPATETEMIDHEWEQRRHERLLREARQEHILRIGAMVLVASILVLLLLG